MEHVIVPATVSMKQIIVPATINMKQIIVPATKMYQAIGDDLNIVVC